MQLILIILRLIHIAAGTFWAGSALMLALVILPVPLRVLGAFLLAWPAASTASELHRS